MFGFNSVLTLDEKIRHYFSSTEQAKNFNITTNQNLHHYIMKYITDGL